MNRLPGLDAGISHLVVFPYSSNIERRPGGEPMPRLSVLSSMAIDSALAIWQDNPETRIVMPGETCYPVGFPDTTDLMVERAKKVADVPDKVLIDLHKLPGNIPLNNTHLQAEAVANYFATAPMDEDQRVLTITLAYHQRRVRHACDIRGIDTAYVTAEHILKWAGKLDGYRAYLPGFQQLQRSERVLNALDIINPNGGLVNWLASHMGARMVDFKLVEEENKRTTEMEQHVEVQKTTSAKRLTEILGK